MRNRSGCASSFIRLANLSYSSYALVVLFWEKFQYPTSNLVSDTPEPGDDFFKDTASKKYAKLCIYQFSYDILICG
jgi:hypothetical protein